MEGTVRHGTYRLKNLARNKIHFRHPSDRLPDAVAACFRSILETAPDMPHIDRNAMTLAVHELDQLGLRCTEVQLTLFFLKYVFPQEGATGLEQVMATLMYRHVVPGHTTATSAVTQLSQPKPDLVYGYSERTLQQYSVFDMLLEGPITFGEASPDLLFPFFCIEFKATATGGNLWVAANQCAGASATCVGIIDQLNTVLGEAGCSHTVLNLCYSLAVDNNLGQLYVSWKDGGDQVTYIQRVESFLFANPEDFTRLCRRVRAILEWGRGSRLSSICQALDSILKGRHRMASK
ncbi:hypothetical protein QBC40DRAFT_185223 [Triangularia verruculosa]|uniref:DUF7924 domain-containing protein n=1 Tax=Triangularia verruculosa TaxID=2587418 RepID=A0AAN6XBT6_9PEZI|nr:hypothetical protein QBC40DRAFT_185223 [Triangularia verruculosa]